MIGLRMSCGCTEDILLDIPVLNTIIGDMLDIQDRILDYVTPFQFQNTTLIGIKINLEKLFGRNSIQFQISIKDKKIAIEGPEILRSTPFVLRGEIEFTTIDSRDNGNRFWFGLVNNDQTNGH